MEPYIQSDRVMGLNMNLSNRKLMFISAYLPHDRYDDQIVNQTYHEINNLILQAKSKHRKVIMGEDFQCDIDEYERGSFLRGWATGHNMSIANIEVAQEWHKSWTFLSSKERQR